MLTRNVPQRLRLEEAAPDGSQAWLAQRRKGIGGSDASALFGCHPWMSPYTLFLDKTTGVPDRDYNAVLEVGHALEPLTRRLYIEDSGREVMPSQGTYVPEEFPWMRGNIDGEIDRVDGCPGTTQGVFEGKTTNPYAKYDWEREGAPLYYLVQTTHYMICTGRDWASIAVLVLGVREPLLWQDLELDQEFAEMVIEAERVFWHDHVLAGEPPEIDAHPATTAMIKKLHPDDTGVVLDLPDQIATYAEKLGDAKAHAKEVKAEIDKYENRIRAAMGDATVGEFPDGSGCSMKTQDMAAHMRRASKSRPLRFHKAGKNMSKAKAQADLRLRELVRGIR